MYFQVVLATRLQRLSRTINSSTKPAQSRSSFFPKHDGCISFAVHIAVASATFSCTRGAKERGFRDSAQRRRTLRVSQWRGKLVQTDRALRTESFL